MSISGPYEPEPSRQFVQISSLNLLAQHLDPSTPILPLRLPPPPPSDRGQAHEEIGSIRDLSLSSGIRSLENIQKLDRVRVQGVSLVTFAKNHPFLTMGFALGIVLMLAAFPIVGSAFAHVKGITLFHGSIGTNLLVGLTLTYYGVYLINLARRAKQKDLSEAKLQAQLELNKEFFKSIQEASKETILSSAEKSVAKIKKKSLETVEQLKKKSSELSTKIETYQTKFHELKGKQVELEKKLLKLPDHLQKTGQTALQKVKDHILKGCIEITDPLSDTLVLPQEVKLPEIPSIAMKENAQLQKAMGSKMKGLLPFIGNFIKENPGSSLLMMVGLLFSLVAIPALIYFFAGSHSVYLIGTLSIAGTIQFVIYGFSLISEGYTILSSNKLQKEFEENERVKEAKQDELKSMLTIHRNLEIKAIKSVEDYRIAWKKKTESLESQAEKTRSTLNAETEKVRDLIEEANNALISIASTLLEQKAPPKEMERPLNESLNGVQLVAQNV